MISVRILIVALILAVLVATGVGVRSFSRNDSQSAKLTLSEYAEWCDAISAISEPLSSDAFTWSELVEFSERILSEYRAIEPPDEISQYHAVQIRLTAEIAAYVRDQDPDGIATLWELLPLTAILGDANPKAKEELSPVARDALTGHCFDEPS